MEPLVSIVIPTYNRPHYLRLAIESALAQTYKNLEILVHDNASEQDPTPLVASYNDARLKLHRNPTNIGMEGNIFGAAQKATGQFLLILGDDDILKPIMVEMLLLPMMHDDDIVLAFCDHDAIDGEGNLLAERTEYMTKAFGRHLLARGKYKPFDEIALVHRGIALLAGALMRKDAIDWTNIPPPEDLARCGDIYIAYRYAVTGKACYYVPQRLMQQRWHESMASAYDHANRRTLDRAAIKFWGSFAQDPRVSQPDYFKMMCARKALRVFYDDVRKGDLRGLASDFKNFARMGVVDPRTVVTLLAYKRRFKEKGIPRVP